MKKLGPVLEVAMFLWTVLEPEDRSDAFCSRVEGTVLSNKFQSTRRKTFVTISRRPWALRSYAHELFARLGSYNSHSTPGLFLYDLGWDHPTSSPTLSGDNA